MHVRSLGVDLSAHQDATQGCGLLRGRNEVDDMSPLEAHYRNQLRSGSAFDSSVLDAIEMRFL
jgi:hypothetical protein